MAAPREEMIRGEGGELFLRSWRPAAPRAVIAICHGFNAHSGHYLWAADQLLADDLAVYALDLRGRGRSDGERFYVGSIDEYVADVHAMVALAGSREPGLPVFLLGHSAGGVASVVYALDHPGELAGLICESFAYQVPAPEFALAAMKGLSHLAPHAQAVGLKNADFSRDAAHVRSMDEDPLIHNEKQPFQTMAALVHADERLKREFQNVRLPLLILHGEKDRATRPEGSREFFARAGSADKTLKIYDGRFHDLLNDVGRDPVIADIKDWISRRIAAP